jgi:hypothetical protein
LGYEGQNNDFYKQARYWRAKELPQRYEQLATELEKT